MSALLTAPQIRTLRRPSKYAGLTKFDYTPNGTDLELECWMEFDKGYAQTYSEPGRDDTAALCFAEVNGEDIAEILSDFTKEEIEAAFLAQEMEH